MLNLSKYRVHFFLLVLIFVISGTYLAINFAKGYRLDFTQKSLVPNGILSANSNPIGANVIVDNQLKTATNNTLSLSPAKYQVEIKKAGFLPWKKNLRIEKELVAFVDAFLFPEVPDVKPITYDGALNPIISPDGSRIVFSVPLPFENAGLWTLDLNDSLFNFSKDPRQIAKSSALLDLSKAQYFWSPDSRQVILEISPEKIYLLDPNQLNPSNLLKNMALQLAEIQKDWQKEEDLRKVSNYKKVPDELKKILSESADLISFSPDMAKIMYVATASAEIPEKLITPVPSASTQAQSRQIEANRLYVYDIKEDRNFLIPFDFPKPTPTPAPKNSKLTPTPSLNTKYLILNTPQWFPTSNHLVWIDPSTSHSTLRDEPSGSDSKSSGQAKVIVCEYDGGNLTTIYSGSFISPYVFTTPSSSKLVILAEIDFSVENKVSPTPTTVKQKNQPTPTPTPEKPKTNLFSVSFR